MAGWYDRTVFNIHIDHHATPNGSPELGAGVEADDLRRLLRMVRPDMLQYHSAGHPGWSLAPTKVGVTCPTLKKDFLRIWADVCREEGVKFGFYFSTGYNDVAGEAHPEWQRINAEGEPYPLAWGDAGRNLCFNSPYVDEWVIPFLLELIDRYDASHFWFDGDVWSVRPCWCEHCLRGFRETYGEEPPRDGNDARVVNYQFDVYLSFLRRVREAIRARKPDILLCGNWAFTRQHGSFMEMSDVVDWLSGDIAFSSASWRSGTAEATYLATTGKPFDIMNFDRFVTEFGKTPAIHKKTGHIKSELATALAHGARVFYWNNPIYETGVMIEHHWKVMAEVADWVRPIAEHTIGNESAARVAVYMNADAHKVDPSTLNPIRDRGYMAHQAMVEGHIPHDIVNDATLLKHLGGYDLVVIPQAAHVSQEVFDALKAFLERGGEMFLAGSLPETGGDCGRWQDLLGLWVTSEKPGTGGIFPLEDGHGVELQATHEIVEPTTSYVWKDFAESVNDTSGNGTPLLLGRRVGKGTAFYCAADIFGGYLESRSLWHRDFILETLDGIIGDRGQLTTNAPQYVEVVVNRRGEDWLVHFSNQGVGRVLEGRNQFADDAVDVTGLTLSLRLPAKPKAVTTVPEGTPVPFSWDGERLHVKEIPTLKYYLGLRCVME